MEGLKSHIFDWLVELEEEEAATFLSDCEIKQIYIDTLFEMACKYPFSQTALTGLF